MADHGPQDGLAPTPERCLDASDRADRARPVQHADLDDSEFAGLLSDLGAQPPVETEVGLDLKDVTIAALRQMLEGLRPLGEQLADSELRRAQLEAQLEAAVCATHIERNAELEIEVKRLKKSLVQARSSLKRARAKTAERHRVATQRWREIQKLRSEHTRLEHGLHRKSASKRGNATKS